MNFPPWFGFYSHREKFNDVSKANENVHSAYWSDVSDVGARNYAEEEGPVFQLSTYFSERNIAIWYNMTQQHSWHVLIIVVSGQYIRQNYTCMVPNALWGKRLLQTEQNKGAWATSRSVHLVVGSDQGWIAFQPQRNHSGVHLGPDRCHLLPKVLFWYAPECDYRGHTCPKELHQGVKQTRGQFNWTEMCRCENTLSHRQTPYIRSCPIRVWRAVFGQVIILCSSLLWPII